MKSRCELKTPFSPVAKTDAIRSNHFDTPNLKLPSLHRSSIAVLALALMVLAGCSGLNTGSANFDPYVGLSAGSSQLEIAVEGTTIGLEDSSDTATTLSLGAKVTDRLGGELQFSDLGSARLDSGDDIGYQTFSALAVGRLFPRRTGANLFAKAGFGFLNNDAPSNDTIILETNNTANFVTGIGVEYQFNSGLGLRLEFVGHDQDAQFASVGATYSFGRPAQRRGPVIIGRNENGTTNNPVVVEQDASAISSSDIIVRDRPVPPRQADIVLPTIVQIQPDEVIEIDDSDAVGVASTETTLQPEIVTNPIITPIPVVPTPVIQTPVIPEPVIAEPVVEVPVIAEPVVEVPVIAEPVVEVPVIPEPVVEVPVIPEPVVEVPDVDAPITSVIPRSTEEPESVEIDTVQTISEDTTTIETLDDTSADLATPDSDALVIDDLDGDGVADSLDACLDTSNGIPVDAGGCDRYSGLLTGVDFDTGSIFLSPDSQEALDRIVLDLENFPQLNLQLQLQATSDDEADTFLARRRTIEILRFFRARGIAGNRVKTQVPATLPVSEIGKGTVYLRTIKSGS